MSECPYCNKQGIIEPRLENDPHGLMMCASCSEYQAIQPRMCMVCNEYGLILRESGVWICCDCGLMVSDEESIAEHRVASSAGYMEDEDE